MRSTEALLSPPLSGTAPYIGTFGKDELTHLLRRTMFGTKKTDIDFFAGKTLSQVVDILLTPPATEPTPPINNYSANGKADVRIPNGQVWIYDQESGFLAGERRASLRAWWLGNMVGQATSIHEKMVLFWHNHFSTSFSSDQPVKYFTHVNVLRRNALGNFRIILKEMTLDPDMLQFLNGEKNIKTAPDENYGREVQELFTIGKGPDSHYTESDVQAAAHVLTGWQTKTESFKLNPNDPNEALKYRWISYFTPSLHDATDKTFSAFYNNTVIKGDATANGGSNEIDAFISMILNTNECAKYIVRRIYRFFLYYNIDAQIETDVITPLAAIFRQNYDITAVLKTLFNSQHFFDAAIRGTLIKSPLEFTVGLMRDFNTVYPTATDYVSEYAAWYQIANNANGTDQQGQILGDPPNVAGWPAYYQEPSYHEFWLNTDSLPKRLRYCDQFFSIAGFGIGSGKKITVDVLAFADQFGADAYDPNLLVTRSLEILYRVPVSTTFVAYAKGTILLGGQLSDHYWTDAWTAYKTMPNAVNNNVVYTRLIKFYKFLVERPEYQLS